MSESGFRGTFNTFLKERQQTLLLLSYFRLIIKLQCVHFLSIAFLSNQTQNLHLLDDKKAKQYPIEVH